MAVSKALLSSNSDEWTTPAALFERLDAEFAFTLDPCATKENHKCDKYFTQEQDGLAQSWAGERVFCNPPFSQIKKWVEKAFRESRHDNTLVALLIPARTDTKYFHHFIYNRAEIRFIKARLQYGDSKGQAPFPSMIVIFRGAYI